MQSQRHSFHGAEGAMERERMLQALRSLGEARAATVALEWPWIDLGVRIHLEPDIVAGFYPVTSVPPEPLSVSGGSRKRNSETDGLAGR